MNRKKAPKKKRSAKVTNALNDINTTIILLNDLFTLMSSESQMEKIDEAVLSMERISLEIIKGELK